MCEFCRPASKYLGVVGNDETRIFVSVTGKYLQVFDEEYAGIIGNIEIGYCPMCGRNLKDGDVEHDT